MITNVLTFGRVIRDHPDWAKYLDSLEVETDIPGKIPSSCQPEKYPCLVRTLATVYQSLTLGNMVSGTFEGICLGEKQVRFQHNFVLPKDLEYLLGLEGSSSPIRGSGTGSSLDLLTSSPRPKPGDSRKPC